MADPSPSMSLARFAALAEAYGAVLERWPAAEREAAVPLARTAEGRAILERAGELDALLDAYRVPGPSSALAGRVLARAGGLARRRRTMQRWWAGLGLAGVGLAGAIVAATAATVILPRSDAGWGMATDAGVWGGGDDVDIDLGRDAL
ncbi:hypothetical protein [uncultured Alsobacter sp.]|uniref:hypothetical protein n=1 Tax=uncultured Alsobacter sp. TaxID=1748258 RepID=UPI0025E72CC9|nr:hypothetical protein [uncultured Alsobacter sp.]